MKKVLSLLAHLVFGVLIFFSFRKLYFVMDPIFPVRVNKESLSAIGVTIFFMSVSILFPFITTFVFLCEDTLNEIKWKIQIGFMRMLIVLNDVLLTFIIGFLPMFLFKNGWGIFTSFILGAGYTSWRIVAIYSHVQNNKQAGLFWNVEEYIEDSGNDYIKISKLEFLYGKYLKSSKI